MTKATYAEFERRMAAQVDARKALERGKARFAGNEEVILAATNQISQD